MKKAYFYYRIYHKICLGKGYIIMQKKNIKLFLITLLTIFLFPGSVFAAEGISLKVNKTDLKAGDTVNISAKLPKDYKTYALMATLTYDENVFERINDTNFMPSDQTVEISYNPSNHKFGLINQSGQVANNLFQISLKVKDDANVGKTNIALTNISASDGESKTSFPQVSTKVLITRDAKDGDTIPNNKENTIKETQEKTVKVFSTKPIIIVLSIGSVILFGLLIYLLVTKKASRGLLIGLNGILILAVGTILVLVILNGQKRDVNNDGIKDYDDAQDIIKYLIDIEGQGQNQTSGNADSSQTGKKPSSNSNGSSNTKPVNKGNSNNSKDNHNSDYDVNNDGKVDIADAGSSTQETTEKTTVKLTEDKDNAYYLDKGEVTFHFNAVIKPSNVKIEKLKIGDKYYDVKLNDGVYELTLTTPDKAGKWQFTITDVVLSNGKTVKVNLTLIKDILKVKPAINKFNLDDEKGTISFNMVDPDKAFIEGTVNIFEGNDKIISQKVKDSTKINNIPLEADKEYHIEILGTYDLDSEIYDIDNHYTDAVMFDHDYVIGGDYDFALTNVKITDELQPGELPIVSFESMNTRQAKVISAQLTNDNKALKDSQISKIDESKYELILSEASITPGEHTVELNSVLLDSLKTFENQKDYEANTLTYTVLKEAPKAEDIVLTDNKNNSSIDVTFKLNDKNDAVSRLLIVLFDSTKKIAARQEINAEEIAALEDNIVKASLKYDNSTDGCYNVVIYANYALSDKYHYNNANIGEKDILSPKDIQILDMYLIDAKNKRIESPYISKENSTFTVAFEINIGKGITSYRSYGGFNYITINGLNCPISTIAAPDAKTGRTTYLIKATVKVPSEAGIFELKTNRVQLANNAYWHIYTDYFATNEKTLQVEILKDKPKITNLKVSNEDYASGKVTFDFDIVLDAKAGLNDNSFTEGILTLDGKTGSPEKITTAGTQHVTFENVTPDKVLDLIFNATFDLDSNTLDPDKNELKENILETKYGLYNKETYQDVTVTNATTDKKYYEKNEQIKLGLDITGKFTDLGLNVTNVVINNKEYTLTKTDTGYEVILDGYHSAGEKELTITDVIFEYGQKVTLPNSLNVSVEILKDPVKFNNLEYTFDNDKIKVILTNKDADNSLVDEAHVIITAENGTVVYNDVYKKEITLTKDPNIIRYFVKVVGSYDRDIDTTKNSDNYYGDVTFLDEIISLDKNNIELKSIVDINLYKQEKDGDYDKVTLIEEVSEEELNKNKDVYFVEAILEDQPSVRARIKEVTVKDNHLFIILDLAYATKGGDVKANEVSIDFGRVADNGLARNEYHPEDAFRTLLAELKNNDNITLTRNYDASGIEVDTTTYADKVFTGTFNGNGFTIKNLTKPLYLSVEGGTVENLRLESVNMSPVNGSGTIALTAKKATFDRIFVDRYTKNNNVDAPAGVIVGTATDSTIKNCRVTNFTISSGWANKQQIGGLVGGTSNTDVINCYASGTITGGWNYRAGLIGMISTGGTIANNYAKVNLDSGMGRNLICGVACGGSNAIFKNNLSLSYGVIDYPISGNRKESTNNYYVVSGSNPDSKVETEIKITNEDITPELFSSKLNFTSDNWYLNNVSSDNLPVLQAERKAIVDSAENTDYDENKENLYNNLLKLMPYYDGNKIVKAGKNITDENLINKKIQHLVALDNQGNIVTYLTNEDVRKVAKLIIVYTDKTKAQYDIKYDKTYDMVASYRILSLGIDYNYPHYVIDTNSQVINNLTNYLQGLDYGGNLDILTTGNDSRIYKDFYNDVTSKELKEFVLKYLANSDYVNTLNDKPINDYLEREIKQNQKLERALYTYNYLRRFYDVEIGKMKLYDFVMFNMKGFGQDLTPDKVADLFLSDPTGGNFNTTATNTRYRTVLSNYTKLENLPDFLEYMVKEFSDETDMANWVRTQFKGILVEMPIEGHPEILYTLWDHLTILDKKYPDGYLAPQARNYILPILTLPENAAYIISCPAEFIIGSQRTYMSNPFDAAQMTAFKAKLETYTSRLQRYFTTAYSILEDKSLFNDSHLFILDKRYTKNEDGTGTYNTALSTTDPFHKNFNEVINVWPAAAGNNAAAWGYFIEMQAAGVLDSDLTTDGSLDIGHVTFKTITHESAHNLDARLFLRDNGRRYGGGGEDYADAFLMQSFEKFGIVMNLSINFDLNALNAKNQAVGSNLTPERINSATKIHDFYNKAFEAIYTADYLEAQAFLQLSHEDQAKLAVQVSYPNENKIVEFKDNAKVPKAYTEYLGDDGQMHPVEPKTYKDDPYAQNVAYSNTQYTNLALVENFDFDSLKTIDDLVDKRIMLYPGLEKVSTWGPGRYGGQGYNVVHWYQPNNIYGFPDSYSFKWFSYEMLGYAGYNDGFVEYASNIHYEPRTFYSSLSATITPVDENTGKLALSNANYKSDAMALKTITNGQYQTFEEYKKARFADIAGKLDRLNNVVNAREYVQKFYEALKADVNDNTLAKSSEVRYQLYSTLKNSTDDFRGDVYLTEWQQDASNLDVTK